MMGRSSSWPSQRERMPNRRAGRGRQRLHPVCWVMAVCLTVGRMDSGLAYEPQHAPRPSLHWQSSDARTILRRLPDTEWFDKQDGQFSPPTIRPEHDNPLRRDGWLAKRSPPKQTTAQNQNPWWSQQTTELILRVILVLLGVVLVVVIGLLVFYSLRHYLPDRFEKSKSLSRIAIDPARVTELPFMAARRQINPLEDADRLRQSGHHSEATIYLYGYQLLCLDQSRRIHLERGKTNRMYHSELAAHPALLAIVEPTMVAFEDAFFGKHAIGRERFQSLWERNEEFHRLLAENQPGTASRTLEQAASI